MNKLKIVILLPMLLICLALNAQDAPNSALPRIRKAAHFDKTPPLRDMKIVVAGSRDRSWKDGIIGNKTRDETTQWENRMEITHDAALQSEKGTRGTSGPIYSFPGIGKASSTPPDTDGDIGPDHFFQMVNLSFAIWDKQGNLLYGPVDNSTLWDGFIGPWTGTNDGDPIITYDDEADRWIATQFAVETNNGTYWELVAVSESGDPLGAYYRYAFEFDLFNDYPKFSVWPDGYYSTYNMFDNDFAGSISAVMERDAMLVGDPDARMITFGPYPEQYGVKSAHLNGSTPPPANANWMVNLQKYGQQKIEVFKFETNWDNPENSTYTLQNSLSVTPFTFFNPSVREQLPQPNSRQKLDPLSKYLMNPLQYRNFGAYESMLVNHTVRVDTVAGIRWYELRKDEGQDDWYVFQEGTYCPDDGRSRWMASLAMNVNGDIALGYSITGHDMYPSVAYTGQTAGAPAGVMDVEEIVVINGTNSQNSSARWGDYSAMSVDPIDDSTFWYTGEYMPGPQWGTRIVSFDFGPLQEPTAFAGPDSEVCFLEVYYGQGYATGQQEVLWTTPGNGNLLNANTLTPAYFRGSEDVENGYFELVLTVYGFESGMEVSDTVHVDIISQTAVNIGNDTIICQNHTIQLFPELSNADSLHWSTTGDGYFSDVSIAEPFYTPGEQDILFGEVTLGLYAEAFAPCEGNDEDEMVITIDPCTGIAEEGIPFKFEISPNPTSDIVNISISGLRNKPFTLMLLDDQGQLRFKSGYSSLDGDFTNNINLSYLPKGVYYLQVVMNDKNVTKKIILR